MKNNSKTREIEGFLASQIVDECWYEKLFPNSLLPTRLSHRMMCNLTIHTRSDN